MNIRNEILRAMRDLYINTDDVSSETRLREDLSMDSTELVEMALVLEKRLPILIDDATFAKLRTFGEIEQFVQSLLDTEVVTSATKE
ncbi:MAG: acyl carrier protein [Ktedonobacteraceae bacterium]|nr:acyl carrier protein [Ktedonobacteraceae bacterium]